MTDVLTIVHECTDYTAWRAAYDGDLPRRKGAGLVERMITRQADKPNVIALVFEMTDPDKARDTVASPELRDTMRKAGIIGTPDVHFRKGSLSTVVAANYLSINARITGIEKFRNGYAMDVADRRNAGLTDLAVLQDATDPNDLLLLWAVEDTQKAMTFLKSPALKEHQIKNAGVVSEPLPRFWKPAS